NSSAEPNRPTSSSQSNAFNESLITMVNHVQPNTVNTKLAHMGLDPRIHAASATGEATSPFPSKTVAQFC
ncbi:hypothetical protein, partial [Rhizobium leguminosarum]|uniref:hypothetical protein n=1 Tax=Rhizobium leguminosarum TaxID=384 RepID=UPI001C950A10